jgi:NADH-quinone oxidoreductase subunit H
MMGWFQSHPLIFASLFKSAAVLLLLLGIVAYTTWFERKLVAHIQSRWGPHRVGPHGLLQPIADGLKFLFKEDMTPAGVDRLVYYLAPFLSLGLAVVSIALIPFGPGTVTLLGQEGPVAVTDLNIGILALFAITSLGVYGVALAGWSSNSKYPLLGSLRSCAQMLSYELAMSFSVIGVLLVAGSLNLRAIVTSQSGTWLGFIPRWYVFPQLVGFVGYIIAAIAETNRLPFDLPEAETELVAGFHTEYSSFKFAAFFMAEYANMVTVSCLATILFFGGWLGPSFGPGWLQAMLPTFWFLLKVFLFLFAYVWIRGTLPRFRYDQLMAFGWKFLVPLAITNLLLTSLIVALQAS